MIERVDHVHARNLVAWARNRPDVVALSGDLTGSVELADFRSAYPDRFFSLGMAEQNMLSWAGGMAREGLTPLVHTFAVFLYRRPLDQLEMSIAYPNLRVRLFGFLPGITTPGGASHQAIDDIGILRAIPNMTVLEVGDATDVESALDAADGVDGPVYVRMLRGSIPRLFRPGDPLVVDQARVLREGGDVAVLTSGICTEEALPAVQALVDRGVSVHHLHVTTLKPFRDPQIDAAARARFGVVTFENHSVVGGLGTAVAERIADQGLPSRLVRLGLADTFSHGASVRYLMEEHHITARSLVRAVERLVGEDLGIDDVALSTVAIGPPASIDLVQQEAL